MTARLLACLFCALLLCLLRPTDNPLQETSTWS